VELGREISIYFLYTVEEVSDIFSVKQNFPSHKHFKAKIGGSTALAIFSWAY
jgi:hypothetical protein